MELRVHHKTTGGVLVQLPNGGYGRLTTATCGGGDLTKQLFERLRPHSEDTVLCGPTGETDKDGFALYTTALDRLIPALAKPSPSKPATEGASLLVSLFARHVLCGLGRTMYAKLVSQSAAGSVLALPHGVKGVCLDSRDFIKASSHADDEGIGEDDNGADDAGGATTTMGEEDPALSRTAPAAASRRGVPVRVLSYDQRGSGMVMCTAIREFVQEGYRSAADLEDVDVSRLRVGAVRSVQVLLTHASPSLSVVVAAFDDIHLQQSDSGSAPEPTIALGHTDHRHEGRLLVYCPLPSTAGAKQNPIPTGSVQRVQLLYVPAAGSGVALTPFCVGRIVPADTAPDVIGVPRSRVETGLADTVLFAWRDPVRLAREEATAADAEEDDGEAEAKARRRRVEEALDRFERQGEVAPTTPDEFEKQLLATPKSSYLWTQYMAHHIGLKRVDAARTIGERALKRIPVTEPKELLNVWVAYLNLENTYGTAESLTSVFRRALEYNDDKQVVHERLADIFAATGKKQQLVELCKTMTTKFRKSLAVWERFARALIDTGKRDQLKRLLKDASAALPQTQQFLLVVHTAIHEYRHGGPEHGRALLDSLVSKAPKRSDLWSAYLDQEVGLVQRGASEASVNGTRNVFERVATVALPPRVMQRMLTRWLTFEQQHGTPATVQKVKDKARSYVEQQTTAKLASASATGSL